MYREPTSLFIYHEQWQVPTAHPSPPSPTLLNIPSLSLLRLGKSLTQTLWVTGWSVCWNYSVFPLLPLLAPLAQQKSPIAHLAEHETLTDRDVTSFFPPTLKLNLS